MNFGEEARMIAGRMSYTEYDAKEMAMSKAKKLEIIFLNIAMNHD